MKYLFASIFTILWGSCLFSQGPANNWYFGYNAGISFTPGPASALLNGQMTSLEAAASISDISGNLLFYTNGITVWNASHTIMQNGTGLIGNQSTSQTLIVPQPGSANLYYIFHTDIFGGANSLRYTVVDMSLNNGLGAVTVKNTLLHSNSSERIAAVSHCNKNGVWVMSLNYSTDQFYAYLITEDGICPPVLSQSKPTDGQCCTIMKFSPDGEWLAYTETGPNTPMDSQLFRFNDNTGKVTFHSTLPRDGVAAEQHYGISFSPDNTKLYISTIYRVATAGAENRLYQYDMESINIPLSKLVVHSELYALSGVVQYPFGALQNGPDGRMYLARSSLNNPIDTLAVINSPNQSGSACQFVINQVPLSGRNCGLGLPNFIESYFNESLPTTETCHCLHCGVVNYVSVSACEEYTSPSGLYVWNTNGFYYDTIPGLTGCDSILGITLTLITNSNTIHQTNSVLSTPQSANFYQWLTCPDMQSIAGANSQSFQPVQNGSYAVVIDVNGCKDTSDCYILDDLSSDTHVNNQLTISPNPTDGHFLIQFPDPAIFQVRITDMFGKLVQLNEFNGDTSVEIELEAPSGIYFITIVLEGQQIVAKLVKQ